MEVRKRDIILGNFIGGLSWGFGTVVGASVVVGVIGYVLKLLGVLTFVGNFFQQIPPTQLYR